MKEPFISLRIRLEGNKGPPRERRSGPREEKPPRTAGRKKPGREEKKTQWITGDFRVGTYSGRNTKTEL